MANKGDIYWEAAYTPIRFYIHDYCKVPVNIQYNGWWPHYMGCVPTGDYITTCPTMAPERGERGGVNMGYGFPGFGFFQNVSATRMYNDIYGTTRLSKMSGDFSDIPASLYHASPYPLTDSAPMALIMDAAFSLTERQDPRFVQHNNQGGNVIATDGSCHWTPIRNFHDIGYAGVHEYVANGYYYQSEGQSFGESVLYGPVNGVTTSVVVLRWGGATTGVRYKMGYHNP